MQPFDVIVKPLLSEKSNELREAQSQYVFVVRRNATKADVKKAIKALWDVDVASVRTLIQRGKTRRRGMQVSQSQNTKKAFVTLAEGAKLPLFEDQ